MDEARWWRAVEERDAAWTEKFVYGVLTTGVFCRPGCNSRRPLRKNVRFYRTAAEAAADGLRPCKRCRPTEAPGDERQQFAAVCRFIRRHIDERGALRLQALSAKFGMSPFHFQRKFKAVVGVTPRQYVEGVRMESLKDGLREGAAVTDAIYEAGYGSSSRAYEGTEAWMGMTPRQYKAGGAEIEISWATAQTPLGRVMMAATDRGLCFVQFGSSESELLARLKEEFPAARLEPLTRPYPAEFAGWIERLSRYLEGERELERIPVDLQGTAFQLKVWRYLQTIPAGKVKSYSEVAKAIGQPSATRAVAGACAANRIAVAVPCHRVIRGDGGLGGYRWGVERKEALLKAEGAAK
jgi:AraC family transcriptional regulator of adaptative response/methylated-DNA-[protein]-cysteine methyltransferase